MVDKGKLVLIIFIPLSLILHAFTITFILLSKSTSTKQNSEIESVTTSDLRVYKDYAKHRKRDTDTDPTPVLNGCVFKLKKFENDQDTALKWTSNVTCSKQIASVDQKGRIRFQVSGWFMLSLSLTVNSYVHDRCLGVDNFTRIQIQILKNEHQLIHYMPNIVNKGEERQVGIPGYPALFYKDEEIVVKVTKPQCIYSQQETGYLAITRIL